MIDLKQELTRMSKEFGLTEKEVASNFRGVVRSAWGDSLFKHTFFKHHEKVVVNTNTRSMKRFPTVKRFECSICKGLFGSNEVELDHINGENAMLSLDDAESFLKAILLPSYDGLRILCKDKKRKQQGKFIVDRFGCHAITTYAERYNVSFEQAKVEKEAKYLVDKKLDKQFLIEHNVIPESTQPNRRKQIVEIKLKEK